MALGRLWTIAWRDLGRNRRRTIFSVLAVALGLALLIMFSGFLAGMVEDSLQNAIRLETGHVQLRAASYEEEKSSLQWKDLIKDPEELAAQANAMSEVNAAAPVLWASGYLNTREESVGLRFFGVDTTSAIYAPFQNALVAGEFLAADDRSGILIGERLAKSLKLGIGDNVSLAVINADGQPDQGSFTIRGIFSTGVFTYDDGAVFMPLSKAQAFTNTAGRASAITMLLNRQDDADAVAAALETPEIKALTWANLNALFLQTIETGLSFYWIIYGIVILIVAVIIANTLLMAVFERIREVGILGALGMKGRQITVMFLMEAAVLGLIGVLVGNILGAAAVAYLASSGIPTGDMGAVAGDMAIGATMYAQFDPGSMLSLSLWTLIITMLAALYPAWYASRLEPVEALRAL